MSRIRATEQVLGTPDEPPVPTEGTGEPAGKKSSKTDAAKPAVETEETP